MGARFADRNDAGRQLAQVLERFRDSRPVVLALPRGGVPVGWQVAKALDCPLDVLMVRKIGMPWHPELALGAVVGADPPEMVLNTDVIEMMTVPQDYIREERDRQLAEIERRRRVYLGDRQPVGVAGRTVIVIDDGIATGATIRAAMRGLKKARPARVVLAVPVAAADAMDRLRMEADEVVALDTPEPFHAVGMHYRDFDQTTDDEVVAILAQAAAPR